MAEGLLMDWGVLFLVLPLVVIGGAWLASIRSREVERLRACQPRATWLDRQKERYVQGEIDLDEFEWLVKLDLEDRASRGPRFPEPGDSFHSTHLGKEVTPTTYASRAPK